MTPLVKFESLYLKREDQNPTGSAKDRAISLQVENLKNLQYPSAVISSTGNAAISAAYYCQKQGVPLSIFISPKINPQKLALLPSKFLIQTDKPISAAFKYAKANQSYLLRQSTDPVALDGYQQIGEEIIKQLPKITSIFIPVGSGSTLLGISRVLPPNVKIFAIQPACHCPIAAIFDRDFTLETKTITDSLSAKLLPLKRKVFSAIKNSGGSGIVVQNSDVVKADRYFQKNKIITSPESALAYAGYQKARNIFPIGDCPVILFTGAKR
jgi:threonine dehydratase